MSEPARVIRTIAAPGSSSAARVALGAAAALGAMLADELGTALPLGKALWGLALFTLPVDLLPALLVVTLRMTTPVLGDLLPSDLIAALYVTRLAASSRVLSIRVAPSHAALTAFFGWAILVTVSRGGPLLPLAHIMLYAAAGVALTHRPQARTGLVWGMLGLALYETVVHLPELPARLHGVIIGDPAQTGALLLACLLFTSLLPLPSPGRAVVYALLVTGVAATQTRSVWFALGVVTVAAFLPRRWYVPAGLPLLLAPPSLLAASQVTALFGLNGESLDLRVQGITAGLRRLWENPLTGHGWAVHETGPAGLLDVPVYNLWVHLGVATGVVGVALFALYVVLLSAETAGAPSCFLFLTAVLAMSLTEVPLYGGSIMALLFFALTSVRRGEESSGPGGGPGPGGGGGGGVPAPGPEDGTRPGADQPPAGSRSSRSRA
ncbi:hypothetical protein GCM10017673_06480 [Streptosporangium violaceochromogenes]|nr:hypothetical protein GCM10017673_06480 [Streptosporangium violaceochromogenes]